MEGTVRLRAVRAALFAALCVTLSSTSHVLLSHTPLPLTLVGGVFAAMFLIAFATGRRERGFWAVAGLLVPLELAADTVFTTGQRTCYGPGGGPVTGPLRSLGADLICGGGQTPGTLVSGGRLIADPQLPWLLLTAHVSVGLLASFWLRRGEAALERLARAAAAAALRPLAAAAAVLARTAPRGGQRPLPATAPRTGGPQLPALLHSVVRRGPPAAAAA